MTEEQLRQVAIAACEAMEAARTGRIRVEVIRRLGTEEYASNTNEIAFDYDRPAVSYRAAALVPAKLLAESGYPSEQDAGFVWETKTFPSQGFYYSRYVGSGPYIDSMAPSAAESDVENPDVYNGLDDPEAERWSVLTPEQFGQTVDDMMKKIDLSWLKTLLADSAQKLENIQTLENRTIFELPLRCDQVPAEYSTLTKAYIAEAPFILCLTLNGQDLVQDTLVFPPIEEDGELVRADSRYWRMGKSVNIDPPDPGSLRPQIPPLHTTVGSCDLANSSRYLTFELAGKPVVGWTIWNNEDDKPYIPLAAGDKIRIWGSTRRSYRDKVAKKTTFNLLAAFCADGREIEDSRLKEEDEASSRYRRYYEHVFDVVDQEVTLSQVSVDSEPVSMTFSDPTGIEDNPELNSFSLQRSILASAGVVEGTPVVIQLYKMGRNTIPSRVELEDGTIIYDHQQVVSKWLSE